MKTEFKRGDKVVVSTRTKKILGTITLVDVNVCTFETEYDVDYIKEDGRTWTIMGVPARAISLA